MKERIKKCNILYGSWQMQCCGDPIEIGKVVDLTIDVFQNSTSYAGYHIDFFEDHHDRAEAKLRGLVVGIKAVYIDEYADEKRYSNDPNNVYSIYNTSYIDGYGDIGDFGNHNNCDVSDYIITLEDAVVGVHDKVHDCISNREIRLELKGDAILENCEGHNKSCAAFVTVYRDDKQRRIDIPKHITSKLVKWHNEYKENINTGFDNWSQKDWYNWYLRGWLLMKAIKEILPNDIILYYGDIGMSKGIITQVRDGWAINDGGRGVQIVNDMTNKMEEGIYISSAVVDLTFNNNDNKYKFLISKSDHHFFPSDMVILQNIGNGMSDNSIMGKVIECLEDGIVIEVYNDVDSYGKYSIELID